MGLVESPPRRGDGLFEVYRHLLRHLGREDALNVVAAMRRGTVIDLDDRLAFDAAELSVATKLALADSIMLVVRQQNSRVVRVQGRRYRICGPRGTLDVATMQSSPMMGSPP